jgi:hypothetical protein
MSKHTIATPYSSAGQGKIFEIGANTIINK